MNSTKCLAMKAEIAVMEEDVRMCKNLGVAGIVVGFLRSDRRIVVSGKFHDRMQG